MFVSFSKTNQLLRINKLLNNSQISGLTLNSSNSSDFKWLLYSASESFAFQIFHPPLYHHGSLDGCEECSDASSGRFCLFDSGSYSCMCRNGTNPGFIHCPCSGSNCKNSSECVDGSCIVICYGGRPNIGLIVFLVVFSLALVILVLYVAYRRKWLATRLVSFNLSAICLLTFIN